MGLPDDALATLAKHLYVQPDPDHFEQGEDHTLLAIKYPAHDSGMSAEEAGKALFGAIAALPPIEQHKSSRPSTTPSPRPCSGSMARASKG
ncbi:hypothetical protein ACTMTF_47450 [Nonomuraea sp. ZG12]|uniref:hypothetical protein n=1 Tax=Nonomuraea sp. ZG12 TaxID=3452207 RepID=UPI003F88811A